MHKSLLVITLFTAALATAFSQTTLKTAEPKDSSEQAVLQAIQTWLDADERQDRATLDRIIADDFVGTAPRGRMVNKRDIIPEQGTTGGHGLSISAQDIKVRILGDTAIAVGRGLPKTQERRPRPELRFTVVFTKRADRWQMVAAHLSPVPTE
ncbi:MAG TPA: nuclear transport factor 2 family protein [Pyrinomonadaceae bacterium]|nr:nuclear transport factor 2 family protein [Pyrinomonadaceae bacterium]